LKKPTGPVQFQFYKPETGKKQTEPNLNWKSKPSQTEKTKSNQFEPVFILKNRTEPKPVSLNQFGFGFGLKKSVWLLFYIKTKPNRK
jgi:hypothetical protein